MIAVVVTLERPVLAVIVVKVVTPSGETVDVVEVRVVVEATALVVVVVAAAVVVVVVAAAVVVVVVAAAVVVVVSDVVIVVEVVTAAVVVAGIENVQVFVESDSGWQYIEPTAIP
jgi:hypothetical protein